MVLCVYRLFSLEQWSLVDINDPAQSAEMYTLLTENYVEDDDAMFRFDYSVSNQTTTWRTTTACFASTTR